MSWTADSPPESFKGLDANASAVALAVANDFLAKFSDEEKAVAAALSAAEALKQYRLAPSTVPGTHNVSDVEIFRAGKWNGDDYSVEDLDAMVAAFGKTGFRPPVKLGHDGAPGAPAYGWVEGLRRVGSRLVADLAAVPSEIVEMIKRRQYDAVSAEIYWNLKRTEGPVFKRALKAIALLGSAIPGVDDLKPLSASLFTASDPFTSDRFATYALSKESIDMTDAPVKDNAAEAEAAKLAKEKAALEAKVKELEAKVASTDADALVVKNLQEKVDELTKKAIDADERARQEQIKSRVEACTIPSFRPYVAAAYDMATTHVKEVAFAAEGAAAGKVDPVKLVDEMVAHINKLGAHLFQSHGFAGGRPASVSAALGQESPGAEVDRLARDHMSKHNIKDYAAAKRAVLNANPDLKARYAASN